MNALQKLIESRFKNQSEMAQSIGVSQGLVSEWLSGNKKPSGQKCLLIHKKFGVPLHELRPDIYPEQF